METDTIIGIVFAITGNFLISFGLNLQKISHYMRSFKWWLGFTLMTYGEIQNFIAYGFIPVVMVSSLGIITLISNVIIAPIFFDQRLRIRDVFGTLLASIGVVLIILSLNDANQVVDPIKFFDNIVYSTNFIIYVALSITLAFLLILKPEKSIIQNLAIVAIFGSHTVISTKLLSVLIEASFAIIFQSFKPLLLLIIIVVTSYLQIKFLNMALNLNSSTVVIPLHYIFFNLTVILSSIIVFQDFAETSFSQSVLFTIGVCLTFFSVISISNEDKKTMPEIAVEEDLLEEVPVLPTRRLLQRAKSTSHLLLEPITSWNLRTNSNSSERHSLDTPGSYGSLIVGSGIIVNTFINYAHTTTGTSNVEVSTNSHD